MYNKDSVLISLFKRNNKINVHIETVADNKNDIKYKTGIKDDGPNWFVNSLGNHINKIATK